MGDIVWLPQAIDTLRTLWAEGHATGEIARRLGTSKNSIVGKAHRLGLPPRENPVGKTGPRPGTAPETYARVRAKNAARQRKRQGLPSAATEAARATAPALPPPPRESEEETALRLQKRLARLGEISAQSRREAERRAVQPRATHNSGPLHYPADLPCQWPTGEAKTPGITFECTEPRVQHRPYCEAHCARAYAPRGAALAERAA